MKIIKASEKDLDVLVDIDADSGLDYPEEAGSDDWFRNRLKELMKRGDFFIIAKDGKKCLGFASFGLCDKSGLWEIGFFHVREKHHNKGIGTKMLNKIIEYAKSKGYKKLCLHCRYNNLNAIIFYAKNKFYIKDVCKKWYSWGDSSVLMCRDLV